MRLIPTFLLFVVLASAAAELVSEDECGFRYKGQYNKREALIYNIERPYSLNVDRARNVLYFTYNLEHKSEDTFAAAAIDLNTNQFMKIEGVSNAFATAVGKNGEVYFGNDRAIYILRDGNRAELVHEVGEDIWSMFYSENNDMLIYTTWPSDRVYLLRNGEPVEDPMLSNIRMSLVGGDGAGHAYLYNTTALYIADIDTKVLEPLQTGHRFRCMAFDVNGNAYFGAEDGIYESNLELRRLDQIDPTEHIYGLAFDGDNHLIYSDNRGIYRLTSSEECNRMNEAPKEMSET